MHWMPNRFGISSRDLSHRTFVSVHSISLQTKEIRPFFSRMEFGHNERATRKTRFGRESADSFSGVSFQAIHGATDRRRYRANRPVTGGQPMDSIVDAEVAFLNSGNIKSNARCHLPPTIQSHVDSFVATRCLVLMPPPPDRPSFVSVALCHVLRPSSFSYGGFLRWRPLRTPKISTPWRLYT